MAANCVWIITVGEVGPLSQIVASGLKTYGLDVQGQRWPVDESQAWLTSAQEAASSRAALVVLVVDPSLYQKADIRRGLALFRLSLQTRIDRLVDGFIVFQGPPPELELGVSNCHRVLEDWQVVDPETSWLAKAVARMHVPSKLGTPIKLGLHAHERLGVWFEIARNPPIAQKGSVAGVSGENVQIDFHAVGPKGRLPNRTVNEYEIQGMKFDYQGLSFEAWGLQNTLTEDESYYIRVEGEPSYISAGELPNGEMTEVDLVCLG